MEMLHHLFDLQQKWMNNHEYDYLRKYCTNKHYITTKTFLGILYEEASLRCELDAPSCNLYRRDKVYEKLEKVLARKRAYEMKVATSRYTKGKI